MRKIINLWVADYLWRDQPMRSGYWSSTNEIGVLEFDQNVNWTVYLRMKQLIPEFKITRFSNVVFLYKYSSLFKNHNKMFKSNIKYIFPIVSSFILKKKCITKLLIGWHDAWLWINKLIRQNRRIKYLSCSLKLQIKIIRKCT